MKYSKLKLAALATFTVALVAGCSGEYQPTQTSVAVPVYQPAGQTKVWEIRSVSLVGTDYTFETMQGEKITLNESIVGISTKSARIATLEEQTNRNYIYYRPSSNANSSYSIPYYATRSSSPVQIELDFDMTPNTVYHLPARSSTTVVNNTIVIDNTKVKSRVYPSKPSFTNPRPSYSVPKPTSSSTRIDFTKSNPISSPSPTFRTRDSRVNNGTVVTSPKPQVQTGYTSTNKAGGTTIHVAPTSSSVGIRGMGGGSSAVRATSRSPGSSFGSSSGSRYSKTSGSSFSSRRR